MLTDCDSSVKEKRKLSQIVSYLNLLWSKGAICANSDNWYLLSEGVILADSEESNIYSSSEKPPVWILDFLPPPKIHGLEKK